MPVNRLAALAVSFAAAVSIVACGAGSAPWSLENPSLERAVINATATIPPGPQGELINYGRQIIMDTHRYMGSNITVKMSCAACHPGAGVRAHSGSFIGTYARFPQWNKRARRFIALQDRIAECFLYSMNGHPPPYYSREMVAMVAYIAWLSRGAKVEEGFPDQGPLAIKPAQKPDLQRGEVVYAQKCMICHGARGQGVAGEFVPLWGQYSFNDKAGMSRLDRMGPFVKYTMPRDNPNSLTDQEAVDVSAYVLAHPRPHFNRNKLVRFPSEKAGYF